MGEPFDTVIIGGGPAGATAATLLSRAGWSVAVIEKARFPRRKVCGEFLSATNLPLLEELGALQRFLQQAGPEIRRVGLFSGDVTLVSPMPQSLNSAKGWGRALGREHLDTLLLAQAAKAGASIWQPWSLVGLSKEGDKFVCQVISKETGQTETLRACLIIAAHGSWETGHLPSQIPRQATRDSDLFGFKAHFVNARLPSDLMPVLVFPGGYGGMVHSDSERLSFSCCIRRDRLERIRAQHRDDSAPEAVLKYIQASCLGARSALTGATVDGACIAAGPIRPGIRRSHQAGIFLVGNAAGEAHPIIAEGISMAMQSAWLLCSRLIDRRERILSGQALAEVSSEYETHWRTNFATRVRAAAIFAQLTMRPATIQISLSLLKLFPNLLTWCAQRSGKVKQVRSSTTVMAST